MIIWSIYHEPVYANFHRNDVFDSSAGARPQANRILIVITDGESSDSNQYPSVTAQADGENIIRYAVGVWGAIWSLLTFIHLADAFLQLNLKSCPDMHFVSMLLYDISVASTLLFVLSNRNISRYNFKNKHRTCSGVRS